MVRAGSITEVPVPIATTLPTPSGAVGYIQFNDHIATAEDDLEAAINTLKTANVTDLILDLRYNGGGYLDMASELAYMIGNTTLTSGRTFEKLVFNDKNPTRDPVTGEQLMPTPFHSTSQDSRAGPAGVADAQSRSRLHHRGTGNLFSQRVHHQFAARRKRPGVHHRLDDLRQALWFLPTGQLRDYLLLDRVPR